MNVVITVFDHIFGRILLAGLLQVDLDNIQESFKVFLICIHLLGNDNLFIGRTRWIENELVVASKSVVENVTPLSDDLEPEFVLITN